MADFTPTLYIRLRKKVKLPRNHPILLGHVAQMLAPPEWEDKLKRLVLCRPEEKDGSMILIDMMLIVRKIKKHLPNMTIEHYGEPQTIVEMQKEAHPANIVLLVLIWILLFLGSGLAIMNFHADVSMLEVHQKLFTLVTGKRDLHPLLLQIPYSVGIGAGMILFFNRLFKRKFNEEPNPLEVELFMYEESVRQYVITDEYVKKQESGED